MLLFSVKTSPDGSSDDCLRILIVEDDAVHRELLVRHLRRQIAEKMTLVNVDVLGAATLADGLKLAPTANCTILDLSLRDSTSEETRVAIPLFRPPVIVITGDDDPAVMTDCLKQGAEHVFVKGQTHGLTSAVIDCLLKDLYRLNGVLQPHGNGSK